MAAGKNIAGRVYDDTSTCLALFQTVRQCRSDANEQYGCGIRLPNCPPVARLLRSESRAAGAHGYGDKEPSWPIGTCHLILSPGIIPWIPEKHHVSGTKQLLGRIPKHPFGIQVVVWRRANTPHHGQPREL